MTTTVKVSVPEKAGYRVHVIYVDQAEGNPEGIESVAAILQAGESGEYHAHSTRDVVVTEEQVAADETGIA